MLIPNSQPKKFCRSRREHIYKGFDYLLYVSFWKRYAIWNRSECLLCKPLKPKILKMYFCNLRKIRNAELSTFKKSIFQNAFAVLLLKPEFEILDWTLDDLNTIVSKLLITTVNVHINSDTNKIYVRRRNGNPSRLWTSHCSIQTTISEL